MIKSLRVSIVVSAFNEETNVRFFLNSLLSQQQGGFSIEEVRIASDGSTDNTVSKALEFNDPVLVVNQSPDRVGKSTHLNFLETLSAIALHFLMLT